jgi:hypothetical protein
MLPFHRSAKAESAPEASLAEPTATQAFADAQDTALKLLCVAPIGFGVL